VAHGFLLRLYAPGFASSKSWSKSLGGIHLRTEDIAMDLNPDESDPIVTYPPTLHPTPITFTFEG